MPLTHLRARAKHAAVVEACCMFYQMRLPNVYAAFSGPCHFVCVSVRISCQHFSQENCNRRPGKKCIGSSAWQQKFPFFIKIGSWVCARLVLFTLYIARAVCNVHVLLGTTKNWWDRTTSTICLPLILSLTLDPCSKSRCARSLFSDCRMIFGKCWGCAIRERLASRHTADYKKSF